jgi:hypothetical protein
MFLKMLVKTENRPESEASYDGETYAIGQAQLSAVGCEKRPYTLTMVRFRDPFYAQDWNDVLKKYPGGFHPESILKNSRCFEHNIIVGIQWFVFFNYSFPGHRGFLVMCIVGIKNGQESGGIDKNAHRIEPSAK